MKYVAGRTPEAKAKRLAEIDSERLKNDAMLKENPKPDEQKKLRERNQEIRQTTVK